MENNTVNKERRFCVRVPAALLDAIKESEKLNHDENLSPKKLSQIIDIEEVLLNKTNEELVKDDTVWEIYLNKYRYTMDKNTKQRTKNELISVTFRVKDDVNLEIRRLAEKNKMKITKVIILVLVLKTYTPEERKYLLGKKRENKKGLHLDKR